MTLLYKALLKCAGDIKKSTDTHTEIKFYDKSQQMKLAALLCLHIQWNKNF